MTEVKKKENDKSDILKKNDSRERERMGGRRRRLAGDGGRKGSRGRDEEGWRGRGYNECFLSFSSRRRGMHLRGQRLGVSRGRGRGGEAS